MIVAGLRDFGDKRRKFTQPESETRQCFDKWPFFYKIEPAWRMLVPVGGYLKFP
jgi:hypothetical protein